LETRNCDVAHRAPVQFDFGAVATLNLVVRMSFPAGRRSDNAQSAATNRDLSVGATRLIKNILSSSVDLAGCCVAAVIEIDGGDFSVGQSEPDTIGFPVAHSLRCFCV
jgi:hypothetical protein